ncbi:sensor histidine kinase [Yinghuangia seranimata]|uniref:sensor histidine kinase n=1 Tax=Yinghuangia seranimata TaxID=408067 RepID=UPI00248A991F|nr:histidine kinase [Yinghuangia seranimata]MDI2128006.1 histidine kinase [Yinghuangia seranimata]
MQRVYAWLRARPLLVDTAWAALLLALSLLEILTDTLPGNRAVMAGILAVLCCAVALRRTVPVFVLFLTFAAGVVQLAADIEPGIMDFAMPVVVYAAAAYAPRWASRLALAGCFIAPTAASARWLDLPNTTVTHTIILFLLLTGPFVIAWVLGDSMRTRRAYYAELEDRAARLERERDAQAQVAAAAERARIARELHDVVAHNVSVMVVQADGAAYAIDGDPQRARRALATISSTGREALAEMRRLLGVLRSANETQGLVPQPGVDQLEDLLAQVRGAGLPVELRVDGVPVELSQGVALAAYRIVQEALTNTRKHGGPDVTATVRLHYGDDNVELEIRDDGRGADAAGDGMGHGLVGMRERVAMFGGTLNAGPCPEEGSEATSNMGGGGRRAGGYQVVVTLPLRVPASTA